jgi:hypothetical protein
MALTKKIVDGETVYQDAYIKVVSNTVSKITSLAKVCFYESQSGQVFKTKEYGFVTNLEDGSANAIKLAYEHVKTLPEFVNAVDC